MTSLWSLHGRFAPSSGATLLLLAALWGASAMAQAPTSRALPVPPSSPEHVRWEAAWRLRETPELGRKMEIRPWPKAIASVPLKNQLQLDFRIPEGWTVVEGEELWPPKKTEQSWVVKTPGVTYLKIVLDTRDSHRSPVLNEWWLLTLPWRVYAVDEAELAAWKKLSDLEFAQVIIDSRKWLREGTPEPEQRQAVLLTSSFQGGAPWTVRYEDDDRIAMVGLGRRCQPASRDSREADAPPQPYTSAYITVYARPSGQSVLTFCLGVRESLPSDADFLGLVENCLAGLRAD